MSAIFPILLFEFNNMSETTGSAPTSNRIKFRCKYPYCLNSCFRNSSKKKNEIRFFNFPRNPCQLLAWKKACSISPSTDCSNLHICADHFMSSDFNNPSKPTKLNINSVPRSPLSFQIRHDHSYSCLNIYSPNSSNDNLKINFNCPTKPSQLLSWKKVCTTIPLTDGLNFQVCEVLLLPSDYNNLLKPRSIRVDYVPQSFSKYRVQHDHSYTCRS